MAANYAIERLERVGEQRLHGFFRRRALRVRARYLVDWHEMA